MSIPTHREFLSLGTWILTKRGEYVNQRLREVQNLIESRQSGVVNGAMKRRILKLAIAVIAGLVIFLGGLWIFVFRSAPNLVAKERLLEGKVEPQLVGRYDRAALIAPDGSLWAWGGTETKLHGLAEGELTTQFPVRIGADNDWAQVALGFFHTVALKTNGTMWVWGTNVFGQYQFPTQLQGVSNIVRVAAGINHILALKNDGTLWACGANVSGQIGDGTTRDRFQLMPVNEERDWKVIAAGAENSFAIKQNGTLWAWGSSASVAMEDGSLPEQIDASTNWVDVVSASYLFAGRKADGTIWLGGHNAKWMGKAYGALSGKLIQIGNDADWSEVHLGEGYMFARKRDGSWWIFGDNSWGELGIGAAYGIIKRQTIDRPERLPFDMEPWAFALSSDTPCTMILLRDGTLWTWGSQLGLPFPSKRFREWKLRFNRTAYRISGQKFHGFTMQDQAISARPRQLWSLPAESAGNDKR